MTHASAVDARGVPLILPAVEIRINAEGAATVTIDNEPYEVPATLRRDGVRQLVQHLANDYGPIRVVIIEADGEEYVDIEAPREVASDPPRPVDPPPVLQHSQGPFHPDEDVLVAVIVDRRTPEPDGTVPLRVPPAIEQRYGGAVYLIGQTSQVVVPLTEGGMEHR
ncbi:hypothetical protein ACFX43_22125 [Nocardioides sp. YIM B13467]|uniref:hypothetical protein n=1 Tax=Nocardioides sp. YIM B13467 TaxID=3366294 RepID=UPI00366E5292